METNGQRHRGDRDYTDNDCRDGPTYKYESHNINTVLEDSSDENPPVEEQDRNLYTGKTNP